MSPTPAPPSAMYIGVPKEVSPPGSPFPETRVAATPDSVKKLVKKGFRFRIERGAGLSAGFKDEDYVAAGNLVELADTAGALGSDIVFKLLKPSADEISRMKKGSLLISYIEPYHADGTMERLAQAGVHALGMELIPRTSRAQSMDALSSQANIAGYRAVIEATARYGRFLPLMMTSAGSAKPARVMVLGAGVAGLQAIATARRLGANVEAYDVRAEVKEQILSLGAKFVELNVGEEGSGQGGYAKELSEEARRKQQALLTERLKGCDIIVSTANIPGRRAPVLITEEAVKGMRTGSVIIDMAAANGGNCPLTEADRVVTKHGVHLVGLTNYPALMPADSSAFYAGNLVNLVALVVQPKEGGLALNLNLEDDIIAASLVTLNSEVRFQKKS